MQQDRTDWNNLWISIIVICSFLLSALYDPSACISVQYLSVHPHLQVTDKYVFTLSYGIYSITTYTLKTLEAAQQLHTGTAPQMGAHLLVRN